MPPAPTYSVADAAAVVEGNQLAFTITLSNPSAGAITLDLQAIMGGAPGATPTSDFEITNFTYVNGGPVLPAGGINGTRVTFAAGTTVLTVFVDTVNDIAKEVTENVTLQVVSVVSGTVAGSGNDATGNGQILDNDNQAPLGVTDNVFLNDDVSVVLQNNWLLANDTDGDADPLTVESAADGPNANVTAVGATTTTLTYGGGTNTTGSFTYVATDGFADTANTTVNITRGLSDAAINGGAGNDILIDVRGNEATTLNGGGGSDFIVAGAGNDTIVGEQIDFLFEGGTGTDTLQLAANFDDASDAQINGVENVTLTAAATLNLAQQTEGFTITGSAGIDSITAGSGADTIIGAQNDTLLAGGGGTDTLQVGANFDDTGDGQITGIENVTLTAAATLNLAQQTEGFIITGSAGIDSITAGGGADTIIGAQNDTLLAGGGGTDTLQVGANSTTPVTVRSRVSRT